MKPLYTDWIELYIEGDLSTTERKDFENSLETNPQLRDEYALITALEDYMAYKARMREMKSSSGWKEIDAEVDEAVKDFYKEEYGVDVEEEIRKERETSGKQNFVSDKQNSVSDDREVSEYEDYVQSINTHMYKYRQRRRRLIYWAGGAAAAILIFLAVFNSNFSKIPPETEILFAQYVEETANMKLSDGDVAKDVYNSIFLAIGQFEMNDYRAAIQTFEGLESWQSTYPEISLFRGLIHMEIGENQVALSLFEDCAKHKSPYRKYARWLKNVAFIRLLDPDAAFIFFIERSDGFDNLPRHWRRLITSVNLMSTGRFKEFRQFVNPGAEGPLVLHKDDIIWACVYISMILLALISYIDLLLLRLHRKEWPSLSVMLLIPFGGPLVYWISSRRIGIERTMERIKSKGKKEH